MPTDRVARLVLLASVAVGMVGFGVGFGWTMVRFPRFRDSQPTPGWLPWLTAALCLGALVVAVTTIVFSKSTGPTREPADEPPDDTLGASVDAWAPTQATVALGVFALFFVGLMVPAIAAVDSEARWDPLRLAALIPVALVALVALRQFRRRSVR